jgi:hypothetical protein
LELLPFFHQNVLISKLQVKKKWIEGSNRQTHFWKRTIQRLFHQNFVLIEQMVSNKKIFMGGGPLSKLYPSAPSGIQDGRHY